MTLSFYSQIHGFFNREIFQARTLPDDIAAETFVFTPVETKLIALGLIHASSENETNICGGKLLQSLRKRGISAEQFARAVSQTTWEAKELADARGYIVTFGCHKGRTVGELPRSYIIWALKDCRDMPYNVRRAMEIVLQNLTHRRNSK
jgi:uncharacterized protein (DUF3820 family)